MFNIKSFFITFVLSFSFVSYAKQTISFDSLDGLKITADVYIDSKDLNQPLIVLFHQAGWSRGEYLEIAPKLNKLGFNAMAVDLRSGGKINNITNQTAKKAREAGKGTRYIDTMPDIEAALLYARKLVGDDVKIIAWGSSYSSALVLQLLGDKPQLANAVLSFSPGEYFSKSGKPKKWIQQSAVSIEIPVFITSARSEKNRWKAIFDGIKSKKKIYFIPSTKGNHGSKALWNKYKDSVEYWYAISAFLNDLSFTK